MREHRWVRAAAAQIASAIVLAMRAGKVPVSSRLLTYASNTTW
jgi:hypothetical protein